MNHQLGAGPEELRLTLGGCMEGGIDCSAGPLHLCLWHLSATTTEELGVQMGRACTAWVETLMLVPDQRTMYEGLDAWS